MCCFRHECLNLQKGNDEEKFEYISAAVGYEIGGGVDVETARQFYLTENELWYIKRNFCKVTTSGRRFDGRADRASK